jgi:4,5-DOPA dioxygenase extradiol
MADPHPILSPNPNPTAPAPGTPVAGVPTAGTPAAGPMPAIYLGHGAPPLLEDEEWMGELGSWGVSLPRPSSILIVSAHWQTARLP